MSDDNSVQVSASPSIADLNSRQKNGFHVFRPAPGQVFRRESVYAAQPLSSPAHVVPASAPTTLCGPDAPDEVRLPCSPLSTSGSGGSLKSTMSGPISPNCFFNNVTSPAMKQQRRSISSTGGTARRRSVNMTPLKIGGSAYRFDNSPSTTMSPLPMSTLPTENIATPKIRRISLGSPGSGPNSPSRSPLSSALPNVPNNVVEFLDGMPWLDEAPIEIKKKVAQVAQVRPVHQGEVVIRKGEAAKAIFFVARGLVEVISEDSEVVYAELAEGSIFGEIGILFDVPRTCSCRASTNLLLLAIKKDSFLPILNELPELKERIMKEATERLKTLTNKTKSLNTTNAMGKDYAFSSMAEYMLSFPLFHKLDRQAVNQIAMLTESASYTQSEEVFHSSATAAYNMVYFVLQGYVEILTYPTAECETALGAETIGPGVLFGDLVAFHPEEAMPESELFTRVVKAVTACEMLTLSAASLREYLSQNEESATLLKDEIHEPSALERSFQRLSTHIDYEDPVRTPENVMSDCGMRRSGSSEDSSDASGPAFD